MTRRKTWSKFKKLTGSIAQSFKRQPAADGRSFTESYTPTSAPPSTTGPSITPLSTRHSTSNMAEGEEDFSALPITDRWVHKVGPFQQRSNPSCAQAQV